MLRKKSVNHKKAITLVEVMLSAAITVIVIGGLLHLYNLCYSLSIYASSSTNAITEAQSVLEEIRLYNYNNIKSHYDGKVYQLTHLDGISRVAIDDTNPDLLTVVVTSSWVGKGYVIHSIGLTSLIARR